MDRKLFTEHYLDTADHGIAIHDWRSLECRGCMIMKLVRDPYKVNVGVEIIQYGRVPSTALIDSRVFFESSFGWPNHRVEILEVLSS